MTPQFHQQMFKAGAAQRLSEILSENAGTEKQAGVLRAVPQLLRAGGNFFAHGGGKAWNAAERLVGNAVKGVTHVPMQGPSAPLRNAMGQVVGMARQPSVLRPWAQHVVNNRAAYGALGGAAAAGVGANMYGNYQRQNMINNFQQALGDWQNHAGLDNPFGRLRFGMGYLFGGKDYMNNQYGDALRFLSEQPYFSRANRSGFAEAAARRGFAPANAVVNN